MVDASPEHLEFQVQRRFLTNFDSHQKSIQAHAGQRGLGLSLLNSGRGDFART